MESVNRALTSGPARVGSVIFLRRAAATLAIAATAAALAGCSKKDGADAASTVEAPAVEVAVFEVNPRPLTLSRELPGRTAPYRVAEVRARVDGIIGERLFEEGSTVKKGDVLYRIDPEPYEAQLQSAQASLARAEANLTAAEAQVKRYKELVERRAVSQQEYDDAVARVGTARADVAAAKAAMRSAQIDLGYTEVTAPIDGRIGRSEVTEGAYVQRAAANLLATIHQLDPIYVDVSQSSEQLLRLKDDLAAGRLQRNDNGDEVPVRLLLGSGEYAQEGALQFSEVSVNEGTSSVTLRALFPNKESYLLPGMFVRARVPEAELTEAILVPQRGIGRDSRGNAIALVVGEGNRVEQRELVLDRSVGNMWLVSSGLSSGDRLIVQGLQRVRPGSLVIPVTETDEAAEPAQGAMSHLVKPAATAPGEETTAQGEKVAAQGEEAAAR